MQNPVVIHIHCDYRLRTGIRGEVDLRKEAAVAEAIKNGQGIPRIISYTNLFATVDSTNKEVSVYYESGGYVIHMIQYSSGWTIENLTALTGGPLEWNLTSMAGFNLSHTRYLFYNAVE